MQFLHHQQLDDAVALRARQKHQKEVLANRYLLRKGVVFGMVASVLSMIAAIALILTR